MQVVKRIALVVLSFCIAVIYSLPNIALLFAVGTVVINQWIAGIACLVFAWNFAKMVEPLYKDYIDDQRRSNNRDDKDRPERVDNEEQEEWVDGEGYRYYIKDDEITFQFRNIKEDGRQLSRLIFMREKFFKDK
jgi:hypothetical protein